MSLEFVSNNVKLLAVDTFRKAGASNLDQERITALALDGLPVEKISELVNVQIEVVRRFMPKPAPEPEPPAPPPEPETVIEAEPWPESVGVEPEPQSTAKKVGAFLKGKAHGTKHKRSLNR